MMPIPEVVWEKIPLLLRHRELVNILYTTTSITSHTIMMLIHCQTTTAATAEYRKQCRMPKRRLSSFVYLFIVSLYFFLFLTTFFLETIYNERAPRFWTTTAATGWGWFYLWTTTTTAGYRNQCRMAQTNIFVICTFSLLFHWIFIFIFRFWQLFFRNQL